MSDLFDDIFELGLEYAFVFPSNTEEIPSPSLHSSHSPVVSSPVVNASPNEIDLSCEEEMEGNKPQRNRHYTPKKSMSQKDTQREYFRIVVNYLRLGGDPNFVYADDSCPFLGSYFPRYRGRNLLQTCIGDYGMTKLLLKQGADLFQKDERGHNSYDYCRDPRIKQYIAKLLRR